MSFMVNGTSRQYYTQFTTATRSGQVQNQEDGAEKSVFDQLKEAFPGVSFVTNRDPLAGKAGARPTDTVYLDAEALRKLENNPKYAAYVFAEIQTSLTYAQGYTLNQGGRVTVKLQGAQTMSFYGKTESSSGASSAGSISYTATGKTTPGIFSLLAQSKTVGIAGKAYGSFRQLSDAICKTRNEAYGAWADRLGVPAGEGYYVDANAAWNNVQKILGSMSR